MLRRELASRGGPSLSAGSAVPGAASYAAGPSSGGASAGFDDGEGGGSAGPGGSNGRPSASPPYSNFYHASEEESKPDMSNVYSAGPMSHMIDPQLQGGSGPSQQQHYQQP